MNGKNIKTTSLKRACIFAHYDPRNSIDEYIYYYLSELLSVVEKIIFVTVSDIGTNDIEKLMQLGIEIIKRENIGYDFYSYKIGFENIESKKYDELIICNDSVFGPMYPLQNIFNEMERVKCDFWGITDSKIMSYHLQSYFIVFRRKILVSSELKRFFSEVTVLNSKDDIIKEYEVGLSKRLIEKKYKSAVYVNYEVNASDNTAKLMTRLLKNPLKILKLFIKPIYYLSVAVSDEGNASIVFWDKLMIQHRMPFFKKSLIMEFDGGAQRIEELKRIMSNKALGINYPIELIENYFKIYKKEK